MDNYSDPFIMASYFDYYYGQDEKSEIRLSIFLITSVCVGLPALVWSFRLLHLYTKIRGRISAFILLLLLSDLIELLLNLYTVTQLLTKLHWYNDSILKYGIILSLYGFHLHQLVALEGVLTLKYPLCSANIFSLPCYIIISILVLVFSIVSALTQNIFAPFISFQLGTSLAPLSLLAVTCTIICKAPPTAVRKNTHSVFIVAIVNFVMLYLPFMLIICLELFTAVRVHKTWVLMSLCLMSLRVISDSLLCILVCRGNLRDVQTQQKHKEPNTDQTSV